MKLDKLARDFKMIEGRAAETSGGILMAIPNNRLDELLKNEKDVWHVGEVVNGELGAEIVRNVEVLEV